MKIAQAPLGWYIFDEITKKYLHPDGSMRPGVLGLFDSMAGYFIDKSGAKECLEHYTNKKKSIEHIQISIPYIRHLPLNEETWFGTKEKLCNCQDLMKYGCRCGGK